MLPHRVLDTPQRMRVALSTGVREQTSAPRSMA
jgi:hypothetical protein